MRNDIAYSLAVKYEYECEKYDRSISNEKLFNKDGSAFLGSNHERRLSNVYASNKRKEIERTLAYYKIDFNAFRDAQHLINRLKFEELQRIYEHYFGLKNDKQLPTNAKEGSE